MKLLKWTSATLLILLMLTANTNTFSEITKIAKKKWQGIASYYHPKFNGRKTSTGEIFSNEKLTAANNFLRLGTMVRVTNPSNGLSVVVKINDRMNKNNKRLIDLSQAAARKLDLIHQGIGHVEIEVLSDREDVVVDRYNNEVGDNG